MSASPNGGLDLEDAFRTFHDMETYDGIDHKSKRFTQPSPSATSCSRASFNISFNTYEAVATIISSLQVKNLRNQKVNNLLTQWCHGSHSEEPLHYITPQLSKVSAIKKKNDRKRKGKKEEGQRMNWKNH